MAEIRVEKKSGSSWWMWLIGGLVLLVLLWFIWQKFSGDRQGVNTTTPTAVAPMATATPAGTTDTIAAPAGTIGTDATTTAAVTASGSTPASTPTDTTGAGQAGATVPGDRVTDSGAFASTADKLSLVGREAALSNVRVVRIVGPKSFTLASGSEELLVIVDQDLSRGVGTQGEIQPGNTLSLKGNFQRLQQDEINNISSNRFRDLTDPEREALRKIQVYLHATEFSKIN